MKKEIMRTKDKSKSQPPKVTKPIWVKWQL